MTGLLASPLRNLATGIGFLVVAAVATAAFALQGWSAGDAFYMVVMTIFTVGYGEVHPINTVPLRVTVITLIVTGCTGMIFVTGSLVQLITTSQFQQVLGIRRMRKDIAALSGHVIICGYGRIGQMLARELRGGRLDCVVIERDEARVRLAIERGFFAMQSDATTEDALDEAGIARARVLATVLPDDAANVFITLSARSLNADLTIIARGEAPSTERKLIQAGADRVVLPAYIGAERVAELILFQDVAALMDGSEEDAAIGRDLRRLGLELEVVAAAPGSRAVGMTVAALEAEAAGAFLVVAISRKQGSRLQPPPTAIINAGDGVALVGRPHRARAIATLFSRAPVSAS